MGLASCSYDLWRHRTMFLRAQCLMLTVVLIGSISVTADEPTAAKPVISRLTTIDLANWIDGQFDATWQEARLEPPDVVDDATFLKRTYLDLTGSIPSVSQARDFLGYTGEYRRGTLVDRL